MENREVFRRDGTKTGEIVGKHAPRRPGDYFIHVLIVMKTADSPAPGTGEGLYIAQQRSLQARHYAGKWDMTGGGVQAGETPEEAIIREVREELHMQIEPEKLTLIHKERIDWEDGSGLFLIMYACRREIPPEGFTWDKAEVNDVQILPFHVFKAHVMDHNSEAIGYALDQIEATI